MHYFALLIQNLQEVVYIYIKHYHMCGIYSVYTEVSDGKGGKIKVKKEKPQKGKKGKRGRKDSGPVFSDESSSDDDVDLENMTEEEKKQYFEAKAKRKVEREKRRKEKYGDKYDEMLKKHEKFVLVVHKDQCVSFCCWWWLPSAPVSY